MNGKALGFVVILMLSLLFLGGETAANTEAELVDAAKNQNHQALKALIQQGVDVNATGSYGSTAVLWAVRFNDFETTDLLVSAGANVNAANDFGMRPLELACTNRSAEMVEKLLQAGAEPTAASGTGQTPLMHCSRTGSVEAVELLINHGADVNAKDPSQHQTALMWSLAEKHPEVTRTLIAHGADVNASTKEGFAALHFAARVGALEGAKLLLKAGSPVDILSEINPLLEKEHRSNFGFRVSEGSTPLAIATIRGDVSFALFLLEQGADPNAAGFGFTPLHWAAGTWQNEWANSVLGAEIYVGGIQDRQGKLELAKALLDHGADPNAQITRNPPRWIGGYTDKVGATPFILASFASDLEMMRLLHAAGADPKQVTGTGSTSLMAVSGINKRRVYSPVTEDEAIEAAQFVLDLGVDPAWENRRKDTALHGPSYLGWDRLILLLVESGAKVNAVNMAGTTPYLAATGRGDRQGGVNYNESTAELLVELGADPDFGAPCQAQGRCRNLPPEVLEKILSGEIYTTDPRYGTTSVDAINSSN